MNTNEIFGKAIPWLQLARISALPSAVSNILLGFLLAHGSWQPAMELWLLILASGCLYLAGMILNDVFDLEVDAIERPTRPIPSGLITRQNALRVGLGLLVAGVGLAVAVGWISHRTVGGCFWRPIVIAAGLVVCILLYDRWLKKSWVAPALMGSCRALNILLGASTIVAVAEANGTLMGYHGLIWWVASSIGIFIAGVTLLARKEAAVSQNQTSLIFAAILIAVGLAGVAAIPYVPGGVPAANARLQSYFPLLIGLIALPILRRTTTAIATQSSKTIQAAVITCLRSLIILDAAICFIVVPGQVFYSLVVVSLLIPAMLLGRWVRMT